MTDEAEARLPMYPGQRAADEFVGLPVTCNGERVGTVTAAVIEGEQGARITMQLTPTAYELIRRTPGRPVGVIGVGRMNGRVLTEFRATKMVLDDTEFRATKMHLDDRPTR